MSFDWKQAIASVAPLIGTAIGGPFAGMATKAISQALLGHPDGSEQEIAKAMENASPEQLLALKKADNDFEVQMAEIGLKKEELRFKDIDSARQLFKTNIWPQIAISAVFLLGYFTLLGGMSLGKIHIDATMMTIVTGIIGTLTAGVVQIMNFWFGSSSGSKDKTTKLVNT